MGHCLKISTSFGQTTCVKNGLVKTFGILVSDNWFSGTKLSINPLKVYYLALIKG